MKKLTKDCDMAINHDVEEILDRVRRIETMLFKVALAMNVNPRTGGKVEDESTESKQRHIR